MTDRRLFVLACKHCSVEFECRAAYFNRAEAIGAPLYCGRLCAGQARRLKNPPTEAERKETKRLYDAARNIQKHDEICAKKLAYYYANHERFKVEQAAYRAQHMRRHVEYCQRPEYKAWKSAYDSRYNARKHFGEFDEAFLLLQELDREIDARATRYEIHSTNGTLNKAQMRRRSL